MKDFHSLIIIIILALIVLVALGADWITARFIALLKRSDPGEPSNKESEDDRDATTKS